MNTPARPRNSGEVFRGRLALGVVGSFLVVTSLIATAPIVFGTPLEGTLELLKVFVAGGAGPVGVVLGYYFGRQSKGT